MKELISIVNNKFFAIIDELKAQKDTLETKLNSIKEDIDSKVVIASEYKDKVENSNNIISTLEAEIAKLQNDLKELHDKFEGAGFTELIEAGNKEINGKIIEHNTKISEEQDNIKNLQDEAQNLKDELVTLKDNRVNIETELNNTIVALNYYSSKVDELTIFATENVDKLDEFTPEDDSLDLTSPEDDIDVNKIIDGKIFEEIDDISKGDKELTDAELENILNGTTEEEEKEEEIPQTIEEQLSATQELDDVINQTNEIITNEIKEEIKEDKKEETPDIEEIVIEEDINPPVQVEESTNVDNKSVLESLGFDTALFTTDVNTIGAINPSNANRIRDVLDVHFIDINNIYQNPNVLNMDPDSLGRIIDSLEYSGCIPTTINYLFKYIDKIDPTKLEREVAGPTDSIISILIKVMPDLEAKDIAAELGLSKEEKDVLLSKLSEEEMNIMNVFTDIVKTNYNTLKGLNIDELNKCFTEHPKRFMFNPDKFESILDKYDPQDLVRCINKNVAVIDKL